MMWIIGLLAKCSFQTIFSLEDSKDYRIQTTDNKENLKSLIKLVQWGHGVNAKEL